MAAKRRNGLLVTLAYVGLLVILGMVMYRLLFPSVRPASATDEMLFQAGEKMGHFAVANMPDDQAAAGASSDEGNGRPWVPPPQLPREQPQATPEPDRPVRQVQPLQERTPPPGTVPIGGQNGCSSCAGWILLGPVTVDPRAPTPDPVHESPGLRRTTLPITSQP